MRELKPTTKYTKVLCLDEPGEGGACHNYLVTPAGEHYTTLASFLFQNGPIQDVGVNGCTNEDLLAILIDRLEGFQRGRFACEENNMALHNVRAALFLLNLRTEKRVVRGVEGKLEV